MLTIFLYGYGNLIIVQPDETLIRCGFGCEATFNWQRPPSCNLCEETGFTVEYDIEESFIFIIVNFTQSASKNQIVN